MVADPSLVYLLRRHLKITYTKKDGFQIEHLANEQGTKITDLPEKKDQKPVFQLGKEANDAFPMKLEPGHSYLIQLGGKNPDDPIVASFVLKCPQVQ